MLIDSEWNIKRNFKKRDKMFANSEHCGGSYGALESTRSIINKIMPDRVVCMWDGPMSGIKRKDIFPQYKQKRNKSWDEDSSFMTDADIEYEKKSKFSLLQQKIKLKNYFEELCIRQLEIDGIEADDLIAQYILNKRKDEKIIIFSRDKDYLQLVSNDVSICTPDSEFLITPENFRERTGIPFHNALFVKCIEGDDSDNIDGVKGVTLNTLEKNFPKFMEEKYTLDRLIQEAEEIYNSSKKKSKTIEKVMNSRRILERNRTLMNLKKPFVNQQAIDEVNELISCAIIDPNNNDRSVNNAIKMALKDGYNSFMFNGDVELFFRPFYRLVSKEKEYSNSILNG